MVFACTPVSRTAGKVCRDCSDIVAETGSMVEPLREPAFFKRVFIEYGARASPNGYDIDPIALHQEMQQGGL
jgi:hypothetical protein